MAENVDLREKLAKASALEAFEEVALRLRDRLQSRTWEPEPGSAQASLPFPPWICQPYVRPDPVEAAQTKRDLSAEHRRLLDALSGVDLDLRSLSRKQLKRLRRNPSRALGPREQLQACLDHCPNPRAAKCPYGLCKPCCKTKVKELRRNCEGHDFFFEASARKEVQKLRRREEPQAAAPPSEDSNGFDESRSRKDAACLSP